ncbi:hypothetical protein NNO04_13855 [Citrobacter sp. Awk 4]|uniref:hypothetical protein n=1 Tax=Citrobacter sp. Awk 4 TaxID=2963955 RepID=UPI0023032397|nr:hypothetical protein [Citrobacter sp. Awk 4]MDA8479784.1 hypothetical protein [Citrobacter sp. Awk 4]
MDNLIFCKVDEFGFPHWDGIDFLRWMVLPTDWDLEIGSAYLWLYKTAWLVHYRSMIKQYAHEAQIPALLLAGVAVSEVGGMPDRAKSIGVLQAKQVIDEIIGEKNKYSNTTSVGSIAIQLGVAAQTLGIDPTTLDHFQQFRLSQCLLNNSFNIRVVAFHLRDLILYDNPGIDTTILTDEQIILAGSRYNRGTQRSANDIISSIHDPIGSPTREYSEYGRRILQKKQSLLNILEER